MLPSTPVELWPNGAWKRHRIFLSAPINSLPSIICISFSTPVALFIGVHGVKKPLLKHKEEMCQYPYHEIPLLLQVSCDGSGVFWERMVCKTAQVIGLFVLRWFKKSSLMLIRYTWHMCGLYTVEGVIRWVSFFSLGLKLLMGILGSVSLKSDLQMKEKLGGID